MTPSRKHLVVASVVASVSLLAASCGVAADDVAATYRDSEISTDTVDALASDEVMAEIVGLPAGQPGAVLDGSNARSVLDFLLEGEALIDLVEDLGIEVEADDDLLAEQLAAAQQGGFPFGIDDVGDEAKQFLSRFLVADQIASQGQLSLDPPTEAELRFVYDETADSGRWERTCVTVVAAPPEGADTLAGEIESGLALTEAPTVVPEAQVAIDPSIACASGADFQQLPPELAESIQSAPAGELVGPLEVEAGGPQPVAVFFEVDSRRSVDFEDARTELEAEVSSSLLAVRIAREAEVNPRYGDGPTLVAGTSPDGGTSLLARVQRPEAPEVVPEFGVQVP